MHESFFGLQKRPFLAVPTLDRYCPVASQEAAFQSCARVISRGDGPVAILGGTGLGKSVLCLRVAEVFRRSFEVILLSSSQICSRRALLQNLLFELRMPYRDLSEGELRLSLLDRLQPSNENPSDGLVLIVDEAQTLSIKLLDELRLLTNLTRDGVPRVRLVLCGTMRLEEMLGHPQMESLNQRLACRCFLSPLNQHETLCYIAHKIELCGSTIQSVFTDDSMKLIHRATDGIPRLIDQLADQALRLAAESRQRPVSSSAVEAAWASLQQIPLPWSDAGTPIEHHETAIEYGSLVDDGENDFSTNDSDVIPVVSESDERYSSESNEVNASLEVEHQSFDRPIASPIPSAGMGLSRVTQGANPSVTLPEPPSEVSDAWDDFINPSDRLFQTGAIEDYVDDMLDYSVESSPQPETSAETQPAAFGPHGEDDTRQYQSDSNWTIDEHSGNESVDESGETAQAISQTPLAMDELFGSGFDDEVEIQGDTLYFAESTRPKENREPSLVFEYNSLSQSSDDDSLQPYTELLDSLSTANLEAMTLDPKDRLDTVTLDCQPEEVVHQHDFEGGLARQTRSTILSFADLQDIQHPQASDDRDLLIVEDELPAYGAAMDLEVKEIAAVQPYKQLFSKLRG